MIRVMDLLDAVIQEAIACGETPSRLCLIRAYVDNNPPWKALTAIWLCDDCRACTADADQLLRPAPWDRARAGARPCDCCGAENVSLLPSIATCLREETDGQDSSRRV